MCDRVSIIFPHSWFTMGVGLGDQLRVVVSVQSNVIRTFIKSTNTMFAFFWKKALKLNNNFTSSNLNMTQLLNICYILVYAYNFKISICMKQNIYLITFLEHFFCQRLYALDQFSSITYSVRIQWLYNEVLNSVLSKKIEFNFEF